MRSNTSPLRSSPLYNATLLWSAMHASPCLSRSVAIFRDDLAAGGPRRGLERTFVRGRNRTSCKHRQATPKAAP